MASVVDVNKGNLKASLDEVKAEFQAPQVMQE